MSKDLLDAEIDSWVEQIVAEDTFQGEEGVLLPPAKASGFPHPDNVMKAVKGTTSIALRKKFSHWSVPDTAASQHI